MADIHSKQTRSYNMSCIRSSDTKPEITVRKFLFAEGFRYRKNKKELPGKPDIVLKKYNTVIFVHGCYWHGHEGCRYYVVPKSNTEWWLAKIGRNIEKDKQTITALQQKGWRVIIIWECELKPNKRDSTFKKLVADIRKK